MLILKFLAEQPCAQVLVEIEAATGITRKTVAVRIKRLRELDLVASDETVRGVGITTKGRHVLTTEPAP